MSNLSIASGRLAPVRERGECGDLPWAIRIVDEVEAAFRLGKLLGVAPEGWAGLCPYDWTEGELRTAWLRGFSEGRVEMKARRGAGYGLFA